MLDRVRVDWVVGVLAAGALALHVSTGNGYGIFRDELYYLACADHLDWGYVDHPPLSIALLAAWRAVAGESTWALRVVPALLHAGLVVGTAWLTGVLGGGRFARALASTCAAVAPYFLALTGFWSMNAFDLAIWLGAFGVAAELLARGNHRLWIALGTIVGLGLLNKFSALFLIAGLAVGLLVSPLRREWRSKWLLLGAAIAALLWIPHIVWQLRNDWPTREFIANAKAYKMSALSPGAFLGDQFLGMLPPTLAVWGVGLVALLFWRRIRRFRPLGVAFVVVLAVLVTQHGKPYYLAGAYFPLIAAGAVTWEVVSEPARRRWLRWIVTSAVGLMGLALAPLAIPLLPVEAFVRYQDALGVAPAQAERYAVGSLPQHFADRFGWRELAEEVARAYVALPVEDREACLLLGRNYGHAGALRYFGEELGLPESHSQHNSYFYWGPGPGPYRVVLAVGYRREELEDAFASVEEVGRFSHRWAMPYENGTRIWACRGPRRPLEEAWRAGKKFI